MNHADFAKTINEDPELRQIFAYWCNMLYNWKPRILNGFVDADVIERCVGFTMCYVASHAKEKEDKLCLFINPSRPSQFCYKLNGVFVDEEMVVVPDGVRYQ